MHNPWILVFQGGLARSEIVDLRVGDLAPLVVRHFTAVFSYVLRLIVPLYPPNRSVNPVLAVNDRYSEGEVYGSFLTKTLSYPSIHTVGRITFRDWGYRFDPFKRSSFPF